jgi:Flp pilus assembly protein TadG
MLEFAIAAAVLLPSMGGTFQFGYTFYTYNLLESAAANAARYGAYRTYRGGSAADIEKVKLAVRNMAVYGTPAPGDNAVPVVRNLSPANIEVNYAVDEAGVPLGVKVSVTNYNIIAIFKTVRLNGKPEVAFPFLGRYAPEESEP